MASKHKHSSTVAPRVAAYLRISVARDDSVSLEGQRALVEALCERKGWGAPVWFTDEGVSGSKDIVRPERDALEARIAAGEFGVLVAKSVDRIARSVADFARIAAVCERAGCALIVTDMDNMDATTPVGKLMLQMLATLAEFEAGVTGARVSGANETKRASIRENRTARVIAGAAPYGFRHETRDGARFRTIDAGEAAMVRRVAADLLAGRSVRNIAAALNAEGVPAPGSERNAPGTPRGETVPSGSLWSTSTLAKVMRNASLYGATVSHGDVVRGDDGLAVIDPGCVLLDRETFEAVGVALSARTSGGRRSRTDADAVSLLLAGVAVCAGCGEPLVRSTTGGQWVNYACRAARSARCAVPAAVSARKLDEHVTAHFLAWFADMPQTYMRPTSDPAASARLAEVRAEIAATVAALGTADDAGRIGELAGRLTALRGTEAEALQGVTAGPVYVVTSTGYTYGEAWEVGTLAERRALLAELDYRVTVERGPKRAKGEPFVPLAERVSITTNHDGL